MLNTFITPVNSLLLHLKDKQLTAQQKKGSKRRIGTCLTTTQYKYFLEYRTSFYTGGQGV